MNTSKGQVYSEELRGQLSEALPNAVGIFAEALYGKDPDGEAKLFKAMEKGQVKLEELVKVIDHMKTLSREDLIKKMLDSPAKKMEKMRTAWSRLLTEINSSFMLDTFTFVFDTMADGIRDITKWMKENKPEIDDWVFRIKTLGKVLWELVPALAAVWAMKKVFSLFGLFQGVTAVSLLRRLITGRFSAASLFTLLFGRMGGGSLATRFGFLLGTALKAGLALAKRTLIGAALLFIVELVDTLNGRDTWLSAFAQSENPFIAWAARIPILLGEAVSNLGIGALLGTDWLNALLFGDEQDMKFVEDAMSMWATDMKATIKKYGLEPLFTFLQLELKKLMLIGSALKRAATLDFDGAKAAMVEFGAVTIQQAGGMASSKPLQMPVGTSPYSASNPSFMLPNNTQPIMSPNLSLIVNVQGTPDDVVKMANDSFTTLLQSTLLGTMANHQGGK